MALQMSIICRFGCKGISPFHGNGETLYLFVLTQFLMENRVTLFLDLL
ncbi:hypothetical protein SAMN03159463_00771 [Mesorhizobium sp. NFR06]|nr:hypothetical protein SAMN03159463_00771 [Mesorhizobium sp. NFR06]